MKVVITGGAGFIGSYICERLLNSGHSVVCIENFSKYGRINRDFFNHERFELLEADAQDPEVLISVSKDADIVIACAAMIGGISYFHKYAYDLLATNERILASTFDAAIKAYSTGKLKRIIVLSSSMVFENATLYPTPEAEIQRAPPPSSTYGFQKLASEYFAKGAFEQYGLPYTIVRPFNCVGVGEGRAMSDQDIWSGNVKLALSHVLPDLAQKMAKGQHPLHLLGDGGQVRCYTHGKDIARAVEIVMTHTNAVNQDFNISTSRSTTVKDLASLVWREFRDDEPVFEYDEPFQYDVQCRIPDVTKARELLGFSADITLEESVKEVCDWVKLSVKAGVL
jgi:nucleoside-diphosphate-sugar epimerase